MSEVAITNAFTTAIEKATSDLLSTQLPGKFKMVSYPPGFPPSVTYNMPPIYNKSLLKAFDGQLEVGSNGLCTIADSQFSTRYSQMLQAAKYTYSTKDNVIINDPATADQRGQVIAIANSSGFANACMKDASGNMKPLTYFNVVDSALKTFLDGAPLTLENTSKVAAQLTAVGYPELSAALTVYVNEASAAQSINVQQASQMARLRLAMENATKPTVGNGGIPTANPETMAPEMYVGWTPMPASTQLRSMLAGSSSVSIQMTVSKFSSSGTSVQIGAAAEITIPAFSEVLSIGIGADASYNYDKNVSASSSIEVTMEYKGVGLVQVNPSPLSADGTTGWYDEQILQSIRDGSGNDDVSGFKIATDNPLAPSKQMGEGKPFSRLRTIVISQQPTITMVFSADQADSVTSTFTENTSVSVKLFGLFSLGSAKQSSTNTSVKKDSASGKVTVVFAPPPIGGSVPLQSQVCNILGGVPFYPTTP